MRRLTLLFLSLFVLPVFQSGAEELPLVELYLSPQEQLVQGKVNVAITVTRIPGVHHGQLFPPDFADNIAIDLGVGPTETVDLPNGMAEKFTHRFALFPQRTGLVEISPATYSGPTAFAKSAPQTIKVSPPPTPSPGWFPADRVHVTQKWDKDASQLQLGEPISRIIEVVAHGLSGAQIPPIQMDEPENYHLYIRDTHTETRSENTKVIGIRRESIQYTPTALGSISLPSIEIVWWENHSLQSRVSKANGRKFGVINPPSANPPATLTEDPISQQPMPQVGKTQSPHNWGQIMFFALLALMVGALLGSKLPLWHQHYLLERAYQRGDAQEMKKLLLRLGAKKFPRSPPPRTLAELAVLSETDDTLITQLNASLYGANGAPADKLPSLKNLKRLLHPKTVEQRKPASTELEQFN